MKKIGLSILAAGILCSCGKKTGDTGNSCKDVMCTAMFGSINVMVKDKNGANVLLSDHYSVNLESGDTIRHTNGTWIDGGYVVMDDNYVSKMYNKTIDFRFIGIKDGKAIVNEVYGITADCCHISRKSGKETIIVD